MNPDQVEEKESKNNSCPSFIGLACGYYCAVEALEAVWEKCKWGICKRNYSMGVSLDHWNSRSNIMAILCLVFKKAKDNQKNRNWWYDSIGYCDGNRHVLGYGMDL